MYPSRRPIRAQIAGAAIVKGGNAFRASITDVFFWQNMRLETQSRQEIAQGDRWHGVDGHDDMLGGTQWIIAMSFYCLHGGRTGHAEIWARPKELRDPFRASYFGAALAGGGRRVGFAGHLFTRSTEAESRTFHFSHQLAPMGAFTVIIGDLPEASANRPGLFNRFQTRPAFMKPAVRERLREVPTRNSPESIPSQPPSE